MNRRKQSPSAAVHGARGAGQAAVDGQGPDRRTPYQVIAYCLLSGIVALAAGAAVSLTISGMGRIALWAAVTGVVAVAAGIAYDSRLVKGWFPMLRNR
jgi:hypothetical protein